MLYQVHEPTPSPRTIDAAVACLQRGGLIVFPTDTGYALGCDLYNKKAIDRIYDLKRRDRLKPLSFICSDLKELSQFAVVNDKVYRIMRRLFPGPYTFVLPATKMVPRMLVSKRSSVGIRVPNHGVTLALVQRLQHPIIGTSCTDEDGNPLTSAQEIQEKLGKRIHMILDGGIVPSEPSSVIDFTHAEPVIVRRGKGDLSSFVSTPE